MENELNNSESSLQQRKEPDIQSMKKASDALDVAVRLLEEIQGIVGKGRPKKLKVSLGDKVIAELPLALTAVAAAAIGIGAVLLSKLNVEIEHEDQ